LQKDGDKTDRGSYDQANPRPKVPPPPGFGNQNSSPNPDEVITSSALPVQDILSDVVGVKADYKGGWVVRSIIPNGAASRSDIRVGDVIISLDKTVLSANTVFKGKGGATSVRVRRNGQELELALK